MEKFVTTVVARAILAIRPVDLVFAVRSPPVLEQRLQQKRTIIDCKDEVT